MLKTGQKRPNSPNKSIPDDGVLELDHWRQGVRETVITAKPDGTLNFSVRGGSDIGEFATVSEIVQSNVNYVSGTLKEDDVVLEIQGQKVAGYTQRDVVAWLNHCCRNGNPVVLKTIQAGSITKDLRQFLNTRFQKGSVDHDLQNTIRDNLYLRTVPVTTRIPRNGEVNGIDYTFLSPDEFMALERSGNLLESGIYEGNHYGTPKPSKESSVSPPQSSGSSGILNSSGNGVFPGAHPSSEGKRKRNRSNVEAMAAKNMDPEPGNNGEDYSPGVGSPPSYFHAGDGQESLRSDLGPLPSNWEKAYTERGEVYFIDHNSGTSHWLDPRLSKFQKKSLEECLDNELPYGWEKIEDPHYGTYFIDHVNRRTQYENPVIQAKRAAQDGGAGPSESEVGNNYLQYRKPQTTLPLRPSSSNVRSEEPPKRTNNYERAFFTRNPNELCGERITSTIVKSVRGLGFTIVGGDDSEEEFLQIKSVVPNGPAWLDGKLQMGDVLVYVNETCVLGFTHHDMVTVFQSILPSETVALEVCRGYPLPFDPNDPNTEVVTTVAVNAPGEPMSPDTAVYMDRDGNLKSESYNFLDMSSEAAHNGSEDLANSSVKSMPDLCAVEKPSAIQRPNSTDVLLGDTLDSAKPEFLTIGIVKGAMGFGFTIADSAYGQKVKKILDRQRCKNLMEGDILVDINAINVRHMCHGEVVQVLKDCVRNQEATVMVQRGGPGSPGKSKLRKKEALYRSKTPTADLYSTQPKEVIPARPKTPLVDTRNRSKTPTWSPDEAMKAEENGMYKTAFPYPDMQSPMSALSDNLSATTLQTVDYNRTQSPANELNRETSWNKPSPMHYDGYAENGPQQGMFETNSPSSADYLGQYLSQQPRYYNGYEPYGCVDNYSQHQMQIAEYNRQVQNANADYYTTTTDGNNKRKESTSFEHEQPHPSNDTRYPRDMRWVGLGPGVRIYPAGPAMEWVETLMTLVRQETGFGFRIVGGTEEGSQVSIGHIVPGGAADLDGRLCTGDEIVSVNMQSVLSTSHHHVVQLMGEAAAHGRVTLAIRRRIPTQEVSSYARPDIGYPYDVTVTRRESEGFGFVIISSVNKVGSTIGRIIEGSPAERIGQLHIGDRILAVNHIDIMNLHHGDIVNLIKESGYTVTLTIGPPLDDASSTASVSHREEEGMGNEEDQYHAVELSRGTRGFGFSIRGGREFQNMPLFVLQIAESGPASMDSRLRIGDQIIEINAINTKNMTHGEAIEIIRNGGPSVRLLVRRGGKLPTSPPAEADESSAALRPSSSLAQTNGPVRHGSPMEPNAGYWDRFNQS